MALNEFCIKCGQRLVCTEFICHSMSTGEPIYSQECPTNKLGHSGVTLVKVIKRKVLKLKIKEEPAS